MESSSSFGGGVGSLHLQTAVQRKLKKIRHKLPQGVPGATGHYGHGGHGGHAGGHVNPSLCQFPPSVASDMDLNRIVTMMAEKQKEDDQVKKVSLHFLTISNSVIFICHQLTKFGFWDDISLLEL